MKYIYFVVYSLISKKGLRGESNTECAADDEIDSIIQITEWENLILLKHQDQAKQCTILSYQLLRVDENEDGS